LVLFEACLIICYVNLSSHVHVFTRKLILVQIVIAYHCFFPNWIQSYCQLNYGIDIRESDLWSDHSKHHTICLYISRLRYLWVVVLPVRLKSIIDVLICKLHYGFRGIRHLTLSRQVSFSVFSLNSNNPYVQKLDRMRMID
jgi:hypothetical protein